jgi:hypothetical protein
MMHISTHTKMLDERLSAITTATELRELCKESELIKFYIDASVNDTWTPVDIESLTIKYNDFHRSMAGAFLINRHTIQIVRDVILAQTGSMPVKIKQFLALSSMLYIEEAKILKAVIDKDLQSLFPKLTHKLICEALA